jgi:hypothetical protein
MACKKTDTDENKPDITVCGVHNPEWLLSEINKIENHAYPNFRAVQVYLIRYNEQEYLLIFDMMNSSMCDGERCYTCSGEPIACDSSLYEDLIALCRESNYVLLWSNQ